ncbi:MAG: tRNA-dihydrouridine synthase [Caulobacteraceae bacterium]
MNKLFSGITIKGRNIKNRIVLPPMVCFGWAEDNGLVTKGHIRHYETIAKSGTGLVIQEATCVNKDGRLADTQLGIWSDEQLDGLRRIVDACHKHGAVVLVQIHHAGYKTPKSVIDQSAAPSEMLTDKVNARALTVEEIKGIQKDFVEAAKRAEKAGFDGIELHGAHEYLIDQFMSPIANRRTDEYGGSLPNRARFALEIIEGIKKEVRSDFIIGYRMGGNEPTLDDGIQIAKILEKAGVDLLHVSAGIAGPELPQPPEGFPNNWIVYMGTEIKKHVNIPVIVVNGIRTPENAAYLVENRTADFTAIGKGQMADHNWTKHAREGEPIVECLKCPKCSWFKDGKKCPRYSVNFI